MAVWHPTLVSLEFSLRVSLLKMAYYSKNEITDARPRGVAGCSSLKGFIIQSMHIPQRPTSLSRHYVYQLSDFEVLSDHILVTN